MKERRRESGQNKDGQGVRGRERWREKKDEEVE